MAEPSQLYPRSRNQLENALATATLPAAAPSPRRTDPTILAVAGLLAVLLAYGAFVARGTEHALLAVVGLLLGVTLYHASFGFTAAWRRFVVTGEGRGLRAQMVMLAIAVCLFFPPLAAGELFGSRVGGFVMPAGTSVAVGSFVFGIGMQLGGGCGSGTLFTVGGGSTRMLITLVFFVLGSVLGTHHLQWWLDLPSFGNVSLIRSWGIETALLANLAFFAAIYALTLLVERWRRVTPIVPEATDWLKGPWPILAGAIGLALLNFATLYLAHRPWGVTSAFALWGAKWFDMAGVDMSAWPYWANQTGRIEASVLQDTTSVMNFGIVIGAMAAAALAGKFKPQWRIGRADLATAIVGGLMLGYGARLAFGCNIGAFFSGIASGSLHGWMWLVFGFAGSIVGTRLRPRVGLSPL